MDWINITTQKDAEHLMNIFGEFHDSCIREIHICGDSWVDEDLSMKCPGYLDTKVRMVIHRQFRNPSAIELLFEEVTRFNFVPSPENYDSIIFDAALKVENKIIYWAPLRNWSEKSEFRDQDTWISAQKLRWRDVSSWLGPHLHYGPKDAE